MNVRRHAARYRGIPGLIAPPNGLDGPRGQAAPTLPLGTGWRFVAVVIGLLIVMAVSAALTIGFRNSERIAPGTSSIVRSHLGPGYPAHHGLAGPSRVGPHGQSWLGYPPHFGLAGPSQVGPRAVTSGIGAGYPPHYGLAGPSQLADAN